ncbi:hypothetical protein ACR8AL_07665 [Clavibacter sepedonicus]|uniref:Exported protein n=1 Tax=Clavibacter sepedonicus TaxID=31964 RepID=B0RCS7_CLASE|nr:MULTISPECIES: hypothetical protein [Clavibacter]OQJ49477.1 hypothetical protein B5P19_03870 [Clavibacter sepedonicus]OQJ55367.1 hypothetical protein B5P20_02130 [Clavibacter sepedonicus]CAQ01848.1 putative exported protein [Clavibacter sepedonicus]
MTPSPRKATVNRSIPALVLAGALVLGGALVASPAQAAPKHSAYYSVPFSGDLYVTDATGGEKYATPAYFEDWKADGFPQPVAATISYRGFTWTEDIYADIQTEPGAASTLGLTYSQWSAAGSPKPTKNVLPVNAGVFKYSYSDELFVFVFVFSFGDDVPVNHKLTFAEYAALGYPSSDVREGGFRKLSWLPAIVGPTVPSYEVVAIDFWTWEYWGTPTPQIVKSFDGDRFCKAPGSADIRYVGIAAPDGVKLTFSQWREAGFPAPARC